MNDLADNPEGKTARDAAIERALGILREHFESVQLFANYVDETGDHAYCGFGFGSQDMRRGHVRRWLIAQEESFREEARIQVREDDYE